MLNPKVSQAVAAVLALGAVASAHAVDITTVPSTNILYASGSTAIDPALVAYMLDSADKICDATQGAIDFYQGTSISGGKFVAVACNAGSNISGVAAGTPIAMIKEDNAGSLNGINPINTPTSSVVSYPIVSQLTATVCPAGATTTPLGEQQQTAHNCTGTYGTVSSTASSGPYANVGFADVEAAIFGVNPTNTTAISTVDVPFGVAVSLGLYHALQGSQGLPEDDNVTHVPTLAQAQIAAIFNGTITSWSTVTGSGGTVGSQHVSFGNSHLVSGAPSCYDGTAFSTAADCTAPPAVAPANTNVYFCERGQSSGTQNTAQIFFGNIGCASNVVKFRTPSKPGTSCAASGCGWSTSTFGTALTFAGNGTGDDLSCLEAHDGEGHFAMSFAGTDSAWGTDTTNTDRADWRFIKVNGAVPSIENAASGRYDYWAQSAGYYPSSTSAVNYPASGTVAAAMLQHFVGAGTQVGSAGSVVAIDDALERVSPAFDGGILSIPSNTPGGVPTPNASSVDQAGFRANPVNAYIKESPSNNCEKAYLAPSAPDASDFPTWAVP